MKKLNFNKVHSDYFDYKLIVKNCKTKIFPIITIKQIITFSIDLSNS